MSLLKMQKKKNSTAVFNWAGHILRYDLVHTTWKSKNVPLTQSDCETLVPDEVKSTSFVPQKKHTIAAQGQVF